jgi:hypothetical protein
MHVVIVGILRQHQPQLPASHDEQPVGRRWSGLSPTSGDGHADTTLSG